MIDVISVVEKLDELGYIRANRIINSYYSIYCPFHNEGQEKKASFGILIKEEVRHGKRYPTGWCYCFTCKYVKALPDLVEDLLKIRNISRTGINWLEENIPGFESSSLFDFLIPEDISSAIINQWQTQDAIAHIKSLQGDKITFISEEELAKYRFTVPYMYERKLTDTVIEKYDIGFDANWVSGTRKLVTPCLTFPIHDEFGNVLYIYRRAISTKFFSMPEGLQKVLYGLYQLPKNTKQLIVTEAIIDCLTCIVYGYPAVALYGTGTDFQLEQLRRLGIREIIVCMDADDAGKRAVKRIKRRINDVSVVSSMELPEGEDPNSCTKDQFIAAFSNRF